MLDVFVATINVRPKILREAEVPQMSADPSRAARRGDGSRQTGRERANEFDRTDDRGHALFERTDTLLSSARMEFGREPLSDALLNRVDELRSAEADIMFECFFNAVAVTKVGQQARELAISLELAFEKDPVEIEDDGARSPHLYSNNAVPTLTAVAPSMTASL